MGRPPPPRIVMRCLGVKDDRRQDESAEPVSNPISFNTLVRYWSVFLTVQRQISHQSDVK
jgi:hypothetical protein